MVSEPKSVKCGSSANSQPRPTAIADEPKRPRRGGSVVELLQFHPAGLRFDPLWVRLRIFEWSKESSIGSTWVRSRLEFVGKFSTSRFAHLGSIPRRERVRSPMSLACRLRSERPGFESGFGPTAIQRWRAPSELAQQRRNERRHGTTPTDVTDAEERPQLRHCAWSRKCPGKP